MIPQAVSDVDLGWLARALRRVPARLVACRISTLGADTGFASDIGRVVLTWDPAGGGPASLVLKVADRPREGEFYRAIGDYAGVRVPHCYHAAVGDERVALLLENLSGARFGDDLVGLGVDDTGLVVDALAGMHARWWASPRLGELGWLPRFGETLDERLAELSNRRRAFFGRYGDAVPGDVRALTAAIGPEHAGLFAGLAGPATLLHVDCHADNVAFLDGEPVLFDWQGVARGAGTVDIAHFLASALRGADRAAEPALFARWVYGLAVAGVDADPVALRGAYRAASLRWWIGVVGGLGSPAAAAWAGRQAEVARASVPRWVGVVTELQLGELL